MDELAKELLDLYLQTSKHSNYQILPYELAKFLQIKDKSINSRYEKERFEYICSKVEITDKKILDIGGNTGYFTFECVKRNCKMVDYYEGNTTHANFVNKAKKLFDEKKIKVHNEYYLFEQDKKEYDIIFCLNVVHHLGDDFFEANDIEQAKRRIIECINNLANVTDILVFQMGYNWCGKRDKCLFENGTKEELEQYILQGIRGYWRVLNIGVASKKNNLIRYEDMNNRNNVRNNEIGEFLNRPLFIMKSQK